MKVFISILVLLFSVNAYSAVVSNDTKKIKKTPTLNQSKVIVLQADDFSSEPKTPELNEKKPKRATLKTREPISNTGSIAAPPRGPLKFSLSARKPFTSSGLLNYNYPLSVDPKVNSIQFSQNNMPGALFYQFKLEKGKKYLVEILAQNSGGSGGIVQHTIGSQKSNHELGKFDDVTNISHILEATKDGWAGGAIYSGNPAPQFWEVFEVKITQLD